MKRLDFGIAVSIFVASLALYIRTLAPSLLFGDSAEFQTIAFTLGVGHPSGYPIYILLAKLFTFLPVSSVAYRVNLLSAVTAALTISLVYLILRKLGAWQTPATMSVFFLTFAELFWKHASMAEIYTTAAACLAFIFYCVLIWKESNNPRWLFTAGFFGGLSFGIHITVLLSGIAILLYLALSTRQKVDWTQALLGTITGFVIFLSSFLFLDNLNASAGYYNTVVYHALSAWGMTPADFDSPLERLAFLYFPPQFKGQIFAVANELIQERLKEFFSGLSWAVAIATVGVAFLFVKRKVSPSRWREAIFFITAFVIFLLFASSYNSDGYQVFYIPAILIFVISIGLGFSALNEALGKIPRIPTIFPGAFTGVLILISLWFLYPGAIYSLESRIPPLVDEHKWRNMLTEPDRRQSVVERTLHDVEDNAIIFTDWRTVYNFYYVAHVLEGRTEMDFHETYPHDVMELAESTLEYIEANIDSRPIYFSERSSELASLYQIKRAGSGLFRIERK